MSIHFHRAVTLIAALSVLLTSTPARAQYFGQNKVQYKDFNFRILKTEHFDIYYYPQEQAGAEISARLAERWYARLSRILAHTLTGRQPLVLYASQPDFQQTNVIQGELGEGTGGVTEPLRRRIVLPFGGPLADTDHVIGHELVHAFQFDITTRPGAAPGQSGADRLPLWFIEGMAEYLSLGPVDPNTAMWLRDAARQEKLPNISDLNNPKYFPYRWGQAFWAYVGGRFGDNEIRPLMNRAVRDGVDRAIEHVLGEKEKDLSKDWQAAIHHAYDPIIAATTPSGEGGRMVIKGSDVNDLNVAPVISPDGRWIAYLSSRSFFSIDLYIADANTGRVVRRLTSTATNPHFSSIEFIYSAGAWDRASRQLAIATVTDGRPALAIFEPDTGRKVREVKVPEVDEIFNPTWAPDNHAICFTGMSQGLTDLFLYDLRASTLRRLTSDAYADLQPAWSPDGRRIAFATDRFTTHLDTLAIGPYRLALLDPDSGRIEPVSGLTEGQSINPQWAPDGGALYFLGDPDGIANVYRVTLADGSMAQLTNVGTGVSGITHSSPAISVSPQTGVASFSVYEGGKYDVYTLPVAGKGTPPKMGGPNAAVLPPTDRKPSDVAALLASATLGLPPPGMYSVVPYSAKLSLEAMGQPFVAAGASRFGAAFGGGVSFVFGDMLGNQTLQTAVQFNSGFSGNFSAKDTAAEVAYLNQAHRWNWGVVGAQIPYLSGGFLVGTGVTPQGEPTEIDQAILFRQTERSASGIVAYPFNRAKRFELSTGVTQISFDQIVDTTEFSLVTGQVLANTSQQASVAPSLNVSTSTAAFVSDTTSFGAVGPVQGERYRLEASPMLGTIDLTSLLADYRRYVMPLPFYTLAFRAMHYGRYGSGAEDPRLFPLYIGYPTLVRGYDVNTFDANECVPNATSQCPAFDRLLGSRMLVGNLEFRFPLLRPFGVSRNMYGPIPVELALFADSGVAWNRGEKPSIFGGARGAVSSLGVALRANLFGFAVGEFDLSRPQQRPGKGWVFQFNLTPGW